MEKRLITDLVCKCISTFFSNLVKSTSILFLGNQKRNWNFWSQHNATQTWMNYEAFLFFRFPTRNIYATIVVIIETKTFVNFPTKVLKSPRDVLIVRIKKVFSCWRKKVQFKFLFIVITQITFQQKDVLDLEIKLKFHNLVGFY